ncbi:hypothetical protein L7F22_060294 [Adiantum nelumboides]|nr:hypothetical protein [Adiantum nelumboides]
MNYKQQLQLMLWTMNAMMSALLHEWEALQMGPSHTSQLEDEETEFADFITPILPLLWAGSAVRHTPRYQGTFNNALGQWYIKPRSSIHWRNHFVIHAHADDERWREIFKLPNDLFMCVSDLVSEDIQQGNIPTRFQKLPGKIFTVEKKVAI